MRILVVNPNTSRATTKAIERAALAAASSGTEIIAITAPTGPAEISGPEQSAAQGHVVAALLAEYEAAGRCDGAVIAAFSDPGLAEARQRCRMPVVGIGEAMFTEAARRGRFVLIVPNPAGAATYAELAVRYGAAGRLAATLFLYPMLAGRTRTTDTLLDACVSAAAIAVAEHDAEILALGGGPLADIGAAVAKAVTIPVVESVAAGVHLAELRLQSGRRND